MSNRLSSSSFPSLQEALFDYPEQDGSVPIPTPKIKRPDWSIVRDDTDDGGDKRLDRWVDQGVGTVYGVQARQRGVFPLSQRPQRPATTEPLVSPDEVRRGHEIKARQVLYWRNLRLSKIANEEEYRLVRQGFIRRDEKRIKEMALQGITVYGIDPSEYIKFGEPAPDRSDLGVE